MSQSQDPWDVRWRAMTMNLHGMDFAKGDRVFPKVEAACSMESGDHSAAKPFMFAAPLTRDAVAERRATSLEVMASPRCLRPRTHPDRRAPRGGVPRVHGSTTMGDIAVFYWLLDSPVASAICGWLWWIDARFAPTGGSSGTAGGF